MPRACWCIRPQWCNRASQCHSPSNIWRVSIEHPLKKTNWRYNTNYEHPPTKKRCAFFVWFFVDDVSPPFLWTCSRGFSRCPSKGSWQPIEKRIASWYVSWNSLVKKGDQDVGEIALIFCWFHHPKMNHQIDYWKLDCWSLSWDLLRIHFFPHILSHACKCEIGEASRLTLADKANQFMIHVLFRSETVNVFSLMHPNDILMYHYHSMIYISLVGKCLKMKKTSPPKKTIETTSTKTKWVGKTSGFPLRNLGGHTAIVLVVPSRRGDPSLCCFGAQTPLLSTSHNLACRTESTKEKKKQSWLFQVIDFVK